VSAALDGHIYEVLIAVAAREHLRGDGQLIDLERNFGGFGLQHPNQGLQNPRRLD
jgi:hypothetical protein